MENESSHCSNSLMWWATLVIAVLAVPSFGVVIALMTGLKGLAGIAAFILACWLCTYMGMRLMANPSMSRRLFRKD